LTINPEILAPAGSPEALKSAIDAGADAVYLSGKRFGARQFAANFTLDQIEESIRYAHLRGVKVYITVNTLIKDRELLSVAEYIFKLYEMGTDAVIIQDIGLAQLIHELIPDLTLHASTQMTLHHLDGVKWAEEMGFKRVVLSRELSLEEIREISKSCDIELEIFLHGALCYCYSGQCLLSSFIGGRSGNRGMCAQPCRKPYTLVVGPKDEYGRSNNLQEISLKDHYLISPKDLALYSHIDRVMGSGVSSLKIEGRMRSPEYVSVVVSIYRHLLDKIQKGKGKTSRKDMENLRLTFNRGLTPGHLLKSRGKQLMGRDKPGHRGLFLGRVKKYNPRRKEVKIVLKTVTKPRKGDGLFFDLSRPGKTGHSYDGWGIDVEHDPLIKGNEMFLKVRKPVPPASGVYLTRRHNLAKDIHFTNHKTEAVDENQGIAKKRQNVDISFKLNEENFPVLKAQLTTPSGKKINAAVRGNMPMQQARTRPLNEIEIRKHLLKIGNKPFKVNIVDFVYPGNLFLPLSELNQVRRELIEKIELKILESHLPTPSTLTKVHTKLEKLKTEMKKESSATKDIQFRKKALESPFLHTSSNSKTSLKKPEQSQNKFNESKTRRGIPELSVYVDDLNEVASARDAGFKRIYFEPMLIPDKLLYNKCFSKSSPESARYDLSTYNLKYTAESLIEAYSQCKDSSCDLIWKWPNITRSNLLNFLKELAREMVIETGLNSYSSQKILMNIMVGNPALAHYIKNKQENISIYGSSALNIWNHRTIEHLSSFFSVMTLSPELSYKDIISLVQHTPPHIMAHLELIIQGNLEAMISEDCIISPDWLSPAQMENFKDPKKFWGLKDQKNHIFPLKISSECQSQILNSVEICLVDQIPLLMDLGWKNLAIDARGRGGKYIQKMGQHYQQAIDYSYNRGLNNENQHTKELGKIKNRIKKISQGGITTGNFLRGIEL